MFFRILMYWKLNRSVYLGRLFRLLYSSRRVKIGKNFRCESFPELTITQNGKLSIGDNVLFRRNVEIRAHNDSSIHIGDNIRIDRGVRILSANSSRISISPGVRIGLYTVLNGGDNISLEENSLISGFVYLQTSMHRYKGQGDIQDQGYDHAPVSLGKDVWLGAHVVVLPGVHIGDRSIVGSNAVVTQSVEIDTIVGGVPARQIKKRR